MSRTFVGREAELASIARLVDEARRGQPSVLLVGGDAGVGKSTLLRESARRAETDLLLGRCAHIGGDVIPLAPLGDLVRQLRRRSPTQAEGAPLDALAAPLNPGELFLPVLELLAAHAGDGVLVAGIEDLHWADIGTWDLFEFLARNLLDEHLVVVGTYRANEIGADPALRRRLAELARLPNANRIHLGGLDRSDVAACVASLTGSRPTAGLVDAIVQRGQGNPFFTEQLVAAHLSGDDIPPLLSDLISSDLAAVDDRTRRLLGVIATVGRDARHDIVARLSELDDDEVESGLRAAIDRQLVVVDRDSGGYGFRHALIGEVVYAELLPSERRRLHLRVARTLQQQPSRSFSDATAAGELAFHLDRAEEPADAFVAYLAAADAAEAVAPGVAFHHLDRALQLWDLAGDAAATASRPDRMWQAADLATGAVSNERASEIAREAFAFGPPARGWAWAHERLGRFLWSAGDLEGSDAEFERAAALLGDDHSANAARVWAGLAQAELMRGRCDVAERYCQQALSIVPAPAIEPVAWVMAHRVLGIVRSTLGDPDLGVTLVTEAVTAAPTMLVRALGGIYVGAVLIDACRYEDAATTALAGIADARSTGITSGFEGYQVGVGAEALVRLGRFEQADELLAAHHDANTLVVGTIRLARAAALLAARRGDADAARAQVAVARARSGGRFHDAIVAATVAEVHLALSEWKPASAAAEQGWDLYGLAHPLWAARFATFGVIAAVERSLDARARQDPDDVDPSALRGQTALVRAMFDGRQLPRDSEAHLAHADASITRLTTPDPSPWGVVAAAWRTVADPWWTASALVREAESAVAIGEHDRGATSLRDAHQIALRLGSVILLSEIEAVSRRTRLSLEAPDPVVLDRAATDRLDLTAREAEVLALVAAGRTNRQIGEQLYISEKTASVHVSNIIRKLGVTTRVDAAAIAQRLGVG